MPSHFVILSPSDHICIHLSFYCSFLAFFIFLTDINDCPCSLCLLLQVKLHLSQRTPTIIYYLSPSSPDLAMVLEAVKRNNVCSCINSWLYCILHHLPCYCIISSPLPQHLGRHTGACFWKITVSLKVMLVELYVCSLELSSFPFEIIYSLFCVSLWESIALKGNKRHGCFFHTAQYFILTLNFLWPPQQSFKSWPSLKSQFTHSRWNIVTVLFKLLKDKGQFENKTQHPRCKVKIIWGQTHGPTSTQNSHYCLWNYVFPERETWTHSKI